MRFFEYPYVIITILALCLITFGLIALYFSLKCVKTANSAEEKSFCSIGRLENIFEKATLQKKTRCIIYISVSLENISRLYSEPKSARILTQLKGAFLTCLGEDTEICVYGSKNFVALSPYGSDSAASHIESCLEMAEKIFRDNGAVNSASVRFGYYCTDSTEVNFITAVNRAKQACTMAENKSVPLCHWDSTSGKEFERRIKIENNIHNEIDNNRFFLEYQPIVDTSGNIVGAEVLSRLNSDESGLLTPHKFLPAIDRVGLNEEFDYYIFEKNCKWIANDKALRQKYVYNSNFSRATICDISFEGRITEIADKYGVAYSSLAIEILEDKDLSKEEKDIMKANLVKLKSKGFKIFLDDFGKGYTSFSDLSQFDVDIIKIDREIVRNSVTETGLVILRGIIKTAKDLGFKTLCEGVETQEEMEIVKNEGCDLMQGYYFYRPMPVAKLEEKLILR